VTGWARSIEKCNDFTGNQNCGLPACGNDGENSRFHLSYSYQQLDPKLQNAYQRTNYKCTVVNKIKHIFATVMITKCVECRALPLTLTTKDNAIL
jgi:hypothetical protein